MPTRTMDVRLGNLQIQIKVQAVDYLREKKNTSKKSVHSTMKSHMPRK